MKTCACGSKTPYDECCLPFHLGQQLPQSAVQLMRSRYCAFVEKRYQYILDTHAKAFRQGLTINLLAQDAPEWLGLQVITAQEAKNQATVSFKAWYIVAKQIDVIYESSSFIKQDGRWFYTEGEQMTAPLPKRNEPCVCNSGKKFKQCCLLRC
ncbi:YchJ family protein [Shewanella intestini]|uniref:YchJ family protein n=1 Tax=Shewanella intestini TaxID=2017544 RepID=A0ABS5HZQ1_9GAMM|nr:MULTISPECIES: YchJ family protein [Shewanella]MBR9727260.1 YchJ family protein [Shewanella intestini]MRG36062.1 YchJ family protein [Shewanella sp. XMDDZSB0408]